MREHASDDRGAATQTGTPGRARQMAGGAGPGPPSQALALQRRAGNRATAAMLARWAAHPDPAKKGVMVPDSVAAEFVRFNPPQNS